MTCPLTPPSMPTFGNCKNRVWQQINQQMSQRVRVKARRVAQPSAGVANSLSVKTTEKGAVYGYDRGKGTRGRKRHLNSYQNPTTKLFSVPPGKAVPPPPIEVNGAPMKATGLECIDTISEGLLVRAPIDQTEVILVDSGARIETDVYGRTISGPGLLVLQLRGQEWTEILDPLMTVPYIEAPSASRANERDEPSWFEKAGSMALDLLTPLSEVYMELGGESESGNFVPYLDIQDCYYPDNWNWEIEAQSLSEQLQTRIIYYWVGNAVEMGYRCWDNGVLVEQLEYDEGEVEEGMDDEEPKRQPQVFVSQLSNLTAQDIKHAYGFIDDFFRSQQVYVLTRMHDLKREDFWRLDFVTWTETVRLRG